MPHQRGAQALLDRARRDLVRLPPVRALAEQQHGGARLVDVRTAAHRAEGGELPGALVVDLTVLPWRLDPSSPWRIPEATGWDLRWILVCRHGFSSSLAAWNLQQLGLVNVTDVEGGFQAWLRDGLPTTDGPADVRP